jgi:hypothetical protein
MNSNYQKYLFFVRNEVWNVLAITRKGNFKKIIKLQEKSLSTMNPYNQGKCQSVVHLIYNDCKGSYCKEKKKKSCLELSYMLPRQYGRSFGKK